MDHLIPKINGTFEYKEGVFTLPDVLTVSAVYPITMQVFEKRINGIKNIRIKEEENKPILAYEHTVNLHEEAYMVSLNETQIVIKASSEHGFSNALVSLYQLFAKGKGSVRCGEFSDYPRYERRGFMLDCCRHFFSIEEIKKCLEHCALLKINHFHWHLSEDQGFRIESKRFPKLNTISSYRKLDEKDPLVTRGEMRVGEQYGGYYTQEEIKDLIAYAAARQIEVFPEIDLPGHSVAALAAFPEYSCSGEQKEVENRFGIFEHIYCAGKEETYQFLFKLLDEVCELFPSSYFHLGGDEAPKTEWEKCPHCNRVMKEQGFHDYEELQAYFTKRLIEHLKENEKTPIVWNDAAASGTLDESAILQYWIEGEGQNYTANEIRKNRKFILSNVRSFYCDFTYDKVTLRSTLMYEPGIQGEPIPANNILGIEAPMWCEWIPCNEDLEKMLNPRLLAVSENGWTKDRDYDEFMKRLSIYQKCSILNFLNEIKPDDKLGIYY